MRVIVETKEIHTIKPGNMEREAIAAACDLVPVFVLSLINL